eukprot:g160.t1
MEGRPTVHETPFQPLPKGRLQFDIPSDDTPQLSFQATPGHVLFPQDSRIDNRDFATEKKFSFTPQRPAPEFEAFDPRYDAPSLQPTTPRAAVPLSTERENAVRNAGRCEFVSLQLLEQFHDSLRDGQEDLDFDGLLQAFEGHCDSSILHLEENVPRRGGEWDREELQRQQELCSQLRMERDTWKLIHSIHDLRCSLQENREALGKEN